MTASFDYRQWVIRYRKTLLFLILAVSFAVKYAYIFHHTSYETSINFDMAAYWGNAYAVLSGQNLTIWNFAIFPPFYSYFLAILLKLFTWLAVEAHALYLVIFLNISLSTLTAYYTYRLACLVIRRTGLCLLAAALTAFSYPVTYVNAILLPENLAMPLLVLSVFLTVKYRKKIRPLFLAGLCLGVAAVAKPLTVFFCLPFAVYLLVNDGISMSGVKRVFLLALGVMIMPVLTMSFNYQMTHGQLVGLGSNGGVNLYQSYCRPGKVQSLYEGTSYWVRSPSTLSKPEQFEDVTVHVPFYRQSYFYAEALRCAAENPAVWLVKIKDMKSLLFGFFAPTLSSDPPHYFRLMDWTQKMQGAVILLTAMGGLFVLSKKKDAYFYFLLSLTGTYLFSVYLISMPERRYLIMIEFLIYLMFFKVWDVWADKHS